MQSSRQQVEREIGRVQGRIGDLQKQLAQATDDKNNLTIEMEETMNKLNSELAETKHASELQQRQALQATENGQMHLLNLKKKLDDLKSSKDDELSQTITRMEQEQDRLRADLQSVMDEAKIAADAEADEKVREAKQVLEDSQVAMQKKIDDLKSSKDDELSQTITRMEQEQDRLRADLQSVMDEAKIAADAEADEKVREAKQVLEDSQVAMQKKIDDLKSSKDDELSQTITCMEHEQRILRADLQSMADEAVISAEAEADEKVRKAKQALEDSQAAMQKEVEQKEREYEDQLAKWEEDREKLEAVIEKEHQEKASMKTALEEAKAKIEDLKLKQGPIEDLEQAQREMEHLTNEIKKSQEREAAANQNLVNAISSITDLTKTNAALSEFHDQITGIESMVQALVEGDLNMPTLFLILEKDQVDEAMKERAKTWRGRVSEAISEAMEAPHKFWMKDFYIIFIDPVTMTSVPLSNREPGYTLPEPRKWVQKWGPAIQTSLTLLKLLAGAANLAGIRCGLPEAFVSSTEKVLTAAKHGSSLAGDLTEVFGADIPTPEEMEKALAEGVDAKALSDELKGLRSRFRHFTDLSRVIEAQVKGHHFRGLVQLVHAIDSDLSLLPMVPRVSKDKFRMWVAETSVDRWRSTYAREPFLRSDTSLSPSQVLESAQQQGDAAELVSSPPRGEVAAIGSSGGGVNEGRGGAGQIADAKTPSDYLRAIGLDKFIDFIVKEEGYDEMDILLALSGSEWAALADSAGMKGGHKAKFLKYLRAAKETEVGEKLSS